MLKTTALLMMLLISAFSAAAASPVKARVLSGIGILLIRSETANQRPELSLFKEPSLGRIAEIDAVLLPSLSQSLTSPMEFIPAIVTSKKSGWYRIVYDDGEREGWLEGRSSFQFYRWDELLKNRQLVLIEGLRKDYYLLRRDPDVASESLEAVCKGSRVTSLLTDGDWIRVVTEAKTQGWLRWRDDNSRLVIAVIL